MQGTRKRALSTEDVSQDIVFGKDAEKSKKSSGAGGRRKKAAEPAPVSDNFVAKPRSTKLGGLAVSALVETDLWYQQLNDDDEEEDEVALVDSLNECLYPAWSLYLSGARFQTKDLTRS
jgi:hypothetical protein